jgi:hypothetical protein
MKAQVNATAVAGKTVERVRKESDALFIFWTDGTFTALHVTGNVAADSELEDLWLSLEPHPAWKSSQLWWPAKLVELGIATDVEIKESEAKVKAAQEAQRLDFERQQYEKLKAQFEREP